MVSLFVDRPALEHVYSLHNFTKVGSPGVASPPEPRAAASDRPPGGQVGHSTVDKLPGEWYGPAAASAVLRDLAAVHRHRLGSQLALMVAKVLTCLDGLPCPITHTCPPPPFPKKSKIIYLRWLGARPARAE